MEKQILLLAARMLDMASDTFSNHGCNDLDKETLNIIIDEEKLCDDIRAWNGDPDEEWPEKASWIGDDSLMAYLSYKLKQELPTK